MDLHMRPNYIQGQPEKVGGAGKSETRRQQQRRQTKYKNQKHLTPSTRITPTWCQNRGMHPDERPPARTEAEG